MLLSSPQGEPQAPLQPDAAQWNAGVQAFPEVSPGLFRPISTALALPAPSHWPTPSQSGPEIHAPGRGRIPGIKGAWELTGSAMRKIDHQGAPRVPIFLYLTGRTHLGSKVLFLLWKKEQEFWNATDKRLKPDSALRFFFRQFLNV